MFRCECFLFFRILKNILLNVKIAFFLQVLKVYITVFDGLTFFWCHVMKSSVDKLCGMERDEERVREVRIKTSVEIKIPFFVFR